MYTQTASICTEGPHHTQHLGKHSESEPLRISIQCSVLFGGTTAIPPPLFNIIIIIISRTEVTHASLCLNAKSTCVLVSTYWKSGGLTNMQVDSGQHACSRAFEIG